MPRVLNDKPCEVTFFDRISDSRITLYYRLPTPEERIKYTNSGITRRGNKMEPRLGETRVNYGLLILTGFKDGDFEKAPRQPIASDQESPNYDPGWKSLVKQYAADVLEMLAVHVFEASLVSDLPDDNNGDTKDPANPS